MPTFLIDPPQQAKLSDAITIDGPTGHHLARVHRVRIGEALQLTDGHGTRYHSTVTAVGRGTVDLTITTQEKIPPPAFRITLAAGIIAPDRWKLTLEKATELGVADIVPLITARTQGRGFSGKRERWQEIVAASATQCDNCWWPHVQEPCSFAEILQRRATFDHAALAWELARNHGDPLLTGIPVAPSTNSAPTVLLLIGPTGGWTDDEIAAARHAGIRIAHLGPQVLRAETATTVALTLLQAAHWAS